MATADWIGSALRRMLALAALWWMLVGGTPNAWAFGIPAIVAATLASLHLSARSHLSLLRLMQFLPVFLLRSLVAGFDVARHALSPRLTIEPALINYTMELPEGLPRTLFMNTVSLLPGTLSADVDGAELQVHVLDAKLDQLARLRELEARVSRLFPALAND